MEDELHNTTVSRHNSSLFHTLLILTTALGIRPLLNFSIEFYYHVLRFITACFCNTFPLGRQLLMGLVELVSLTPFLMSQLVMLLAR